jgi:hypothetical protein
MEYISLNWYDKFQILWFAIFSAISWEKANNNPIHYPYPRSSVLFNYLPPLPMIILDVKHVKVKTLKSQNHIVYIQRAIFICNFRPLNDLLRMANIFFWIPHTQIRIKNYVGPNTNKMPLDFTFSANFRL